MRANMLHTCRLAGKALSAAVRPLQATALASSLSLKAQTKSFCLRNAPSGQQLGPTAHRSFAAASVYQRVAVSNSVSTVAKRFFADVRVGEEYERGQQDESTTLSMEAPFGHDENEALANQLGIYKVWEYEDGGKKSMFTMAFQSRAGLDPELRTLEKFLEADNEMKLKQVPTGETQGTNLPPEVTQYFSNIKISQTQEVTDGGPGVMQAPFAASVFKSNLEGFWTIAWHVPAELFMTEPDLMFLFIQTIRMSPKNAQ